MSSHSTICKSCHNQQNSDKAIKEKQEKGITREFLKQEIRNKSFTQNGVNYTISLQKHQKLKNIQMKNGKVFKYKGGKLCIILQKKC